MGAFDFLKKKELLEIESLKTKIEKLSAEIAALSKYRGVIDIEGEIEKKKAAFEKELQATENRKNRIEQDIEELKQKYNDAHATYLNLKRQCDIYTESLELAEYGVYESHFDFDTSEEFKEKIEQEREKQKRLIKVGTAIYGGESITWNGSLSQGQAMVKREKKLMMRAFNGECDSFISSVDWNNVAKMLERILKSFEDINNVYKAQGIAISFSYKESKLAELRLAYEYKKKKKEEKEEQRLIREQMREEEKAAREFEAAKLKAEKEANDYQKAIEKARVEVEKADGEKQTKLLAKIQELEARLQEAEQNKERAISMAQQTKRGHVYVISNIGSFGENVYKIGMTRRLDPMDRVKELGDASVPFAFDVHAIIFSEDAPRLERDLHEKFNGRRLNAVNERKEFFNVSLSEIEQFVKGKGGNVEFTKIAEAEEYRKTVAVRQKLSPQNSDSELFPNKLTI
jgi:hypothetical protein